MHYFYSRLFAQGHENGDRMIILKKAKIEAVYVSNFCISIMKFLFLEQAVVGDDYHLWILMYSGNVISTF